MGGHALRPARAAVPHAVLVALAALASGCARDAGPPPAPVELEPWVHDVVPVAERWSEAERDSGLERAGRAGAALLAAIPSERWSADFGSLAGAIARVEAGLGRAEAAARRGGERRARDLRAILDWREGVAGPGQEWRPGWNQLVASLDRSPPSAPVESPPAWLACAQVRTGSGAATWHTGGSPDATVPPSPPDPAGARTEWRDGLMHARCALSGRGSPARGQVPERGEHGAGEVQISFRPDRVTTTGFVAGLDAGGVAVVRVMASAGLHRWTPSVGTAAHLRDAVIARLRDLVREQGGTEGAAARWLSSPPVDVWESEGREIASAEGALAIARERSHALAEEEGAGLLVLAAAPGGGSAEVTVASLGVSFPPPEADAVPVRMDGDTRILAVAGDGPPSRIFEHPIRRADGAVAGRVCLLLDAAPPQDIGGDRPRWPRGVPGGAPGISGACGRTEEDAGRGIYAALVAKQAEGALIETVEESLGGAAERDRAGPGRAARAEAERRRVIERVNGTLGAARDAAAADFLDWTDVTLEGVRVERLELRRGVARAVLGVGVRSQGRVHGFEAELRAGHGRWILDGDVRYVPLARGSTLAASVDGHARAAVEALRSRSVSALMPVQASRSDYEWVLFHGRDPHWTRLPGGRYPRKRSAQRARETAELLGVACGGDPPPAGARPLGRDLEYRGIDPVASAVMTPSDGIRRMDLAIRVVAGATEAGITLGGCMRVDRGWVVVSPVSHE